MTAVERQRRYERTPKGQATRRRYALTEKSRVRHRRYDQSSKGKARKQTYLTRHGMAVKMRNQRRRRHRRERAALLIKLAHLDQEIGALLPHASIT